MEESNNQNIADPGQTPDTNISPQEGGNDYNIIDAMIPDDLFVQPVDDSDNTQGVPAENEAPIDISQKNIDAERFQYWQRQADLAKRERDLIKAQYEQLAEAKPILDYIINNPDLVRQIEQHYNATSQPQLQVPQKPEKPSNYNLADLVDPNSDTSKYHRALEEYQVNLAEYIIKKDEYREQLQIEAAERQRQLQLAREHQNRIYYTAAEHARLRGLQDNEIKDFIAWASDDQNITLDNLLYAYMASKQPVRQQNLAQNKVNSMQKNYTPPPLVGNSGGQIVDPNEEFNNVLREITKRY